MLALSSCASIPVINKSSELYLAGPAIRDYQPEGLVEEVQYECSVTGPTRRRMIVYLPKDYYTSGKSYPVLYLLHGARGYETSWIRFGEVYESTDSLWREGKAEHCIIVMPNINQYNDDEDYAGGRAKNAFESIWEVDGKAETSIGSLNAGNYTLKVTYNGDANTNSSSAEAKFEVAKADPTVTVQVDDIVYGDVETIVINSNVDGTANVTVNGKTTEIALSVGSNSFEVPGLAAGKYPVEVAFNGNANYNPVTVNAAFNVIKANTTVDTEIVSSIKYGETQTINITVDKVNATGTVTVNIDGVNYTATLKDGKANFTTPLLAAGNHTVTVVYEGDGNYTGSWTDAVFEVVKLEAPFNVTADDVDSGSDATIVLVGLPDDATGYVIVKVNGTEYGVNITQTKQLVIPIDKAGTYDVVATYLGDDKYMGSQAATTFSASKVSGNISVDVSEAVAGGDVTVKVTVPDDATGNITVTVGNETKTVQAKGGENTIVISGVPEGTQNVTTTYSGDDKYGSQTVTTTIYVGPSINAQNLTRGWASPYDYEAEFLDKQGHVLANTDVKFTVNGKTYAVKTDDKGIARLTASKLAVGKYDVKCINPVTGQEVTRQVTIVKRLLENKDIKMDYKDGSKYVVKAIGDNGKPAPAGEYVAVTVNGKTYAVKTNSKGYAKLSLNLIPGKYTITAQYKNTKVSNKLTIKSTISLVKKTIKIKKSAKSFKIKVKLKWSNGKAIKGKKVVVKIKGKKYKAKTSKKGIATIKVKKSLIKKLKKGKSYSFTAKYVDETAKGKVKVKK